MLLLLLFLVRSPSAVVAVTAMVDRDGGESATSSRAIDWSSSGVTRDVVYVFVFAAAADVCGVALSGPSPMLRTGFDVGGGPQSTSFLEIPNGMLGLLRIAIGLFFGKPKPIAER